MAFDAGAIIAHLDIDTAEANRKLDEFEKKADRAARDRHIRLDATFDTASIGKARQIFAALDNQLSRDAASRLRSSPQGSVLGALNALFSPHQISGGTTAQQAVSQGMLGQIARQTAKQLPGQTIDQTVNDNVNVRRHFLGGLLGGIFGRGGGGGGADAAGAAAGSAVAADLKSGGRGGFFRNLASGIGPNILGLGLKGTGIIGGGGSLLGALPALLGPAAALGVGALGVGAGAKILSSALSSNNITQYVSQYQAAQNALQAATTPQQRQQAQAQLAAATKGARLIAGPAGFQAFNALNSIQNNWQNFTAGFLPTAAKILNSVSGLFNRLLPVLQTFFGSAVKLLQPFIGAIGDIASQLLPLLGKAFQLVAPFIRPLVDGLGGLVTNIIRGLLPALKDVGPIIRPFAAILANLGKDVGALFTDLAPAFKASMVILTALFHLVGSLLPVVAKLADIFAVALAPVFRAFAKVVESLEPTLVLIGRVIGALAGAILKDLVSAFIALAGLVKAIGPGLNVLAKVLESVFSVLENSGVFAVLGNALESVVKPIALLINALLKGLAPILTPIIKLVAELANVVVQILATGITDLLVPIVKLVDVLLKALLPVLQPIIGIVIQLANWLGKSLITAFAQLIPPVGQLALALLSIITALLPILPPILKLAEILIQLALDAVKPLFPLLGFLARLIADLIQPIADILAAIIKFATNWKQAWADIKHWAEDAWQFLTHGWGQWIFPQLTAIRFAIRYVADHWKGAWDDIKNAAGAAWGWIDNNVWQPFKRIFNTDLPNWISTGISIVKRAWTDIQDVIAAPVNWVIQHPIDGLIHAFDWISSKVGGPTIAPLQPIGLSKGGRLGGYGGGDVIPALLEPGETVVDKHRSSRFASLFAMMGVPGYNKGGILHDIGNFFGDLLHGGGILAALATGNLTAATNDFMKLLGGTGVGGAVGDLAGLLTAIPSYLVHSAVHELVSLFTSGGGPGGGIAGNVGSYRGVILRVLAMLGQPLSDLLTVERQMTTESGGQPGVVNKWDSNWKAGHPSVGLMQVIQGTFDAYAGPFRNVGPFLYGVSTNPLANIFAGLNYALHAYGPGWTSVLGQGHGYDSGGWLKPGWALNMTKGREAVLTPDQSSAFMTMAEYARQMRKGGGHGGVMRDVFITLPEGATVQRALSDLTFKLNTMTQEVGVMTP